MSERIIIYIFGNNTHRASDGTWFRLRTRRVAFRLKRSGNECIKEIEKSILEFIELYSVNGAKGVQPISFRL